MQLPGRGQKVKDCLQGEDGSMVLSIRDKIAVKGRLNNP
jgi:hypothetical protein